MPTVVTQELKDIRAKADALGVKYHHRAGVEKIKALINEHLVAENATSVAEDATPAPVANSPKPEHRAAVRPKGAKLIDSGIYTEAEYEFLMRDEEAQNAGRLVRCRVTCMNPAKKDWPGEIFSVGSATLGTFKKFIPFDGQPYHIPKIIYDHLKERKYTAFTTVKDARGQRIRKGKLVDEFAIEVLKPLTEVELDELRRQQALAQGQAA